MAAVYSGDGDMWLDFETIERGMTQLAQYIEDFQTRLKNISTEVDNVAEKSWIGDVATAFHEVFIKINEEMSNATMNFYNTCEEIKRMNNESREVQAETKRNITFISKY